MPSTICGAGTNLPTRCLNCAFNAFKRLFSALNLSSLAVVATVDPTAKMHATTRTRKELLNIVQVLNWKA